MSNRKRAPKKPSKQVDGLWIVLSLFLLLAFLVAYLAARGYWIVSCIIGCIWFALLILAYRANVFSVWAYHLRCAVTALRQSRWTEVDRRMDLVRRRTARLPNHSFARGLALFGIADLLRERARFTEAESDYLEALECFRKQPKPNNRALSACINNLGICRYSLGRFAEAEADYQRAFDLTEEVRLMPDSIAAVCLHNLARLYLDEGRLDKAESYAEEVKEIVRHTKSNEVSVLLLTLQSELAMLSGDLSEADSCARRALEKADSIRGENRRARAVALTVYAETSWRMGEFEEAREDAQEALALQHELSDQVGPGVSRVYFLLAQIALHDRNSPEAESMFRRGFALREQFGNPDTYAVLPHLQSYAELLHSLGNTDEATLFDRRAAAFDSPTPKESSSAVQEVRTVRPAKDDAIRRDIV